MIQENLSLEEKLKKAQELARQKAQEKAQADEEAARITIQNQITQLQEKKKNLETLLEQIIRGYAEAAESLGEFKQKKEKVSELYDLYNQLLQNEFGKEVVEEEFGINSDEILSKQDFAKALAAGKEVKEYHESGKGVREKIQGAREAKKQLKQEIQQEGEIPTGKREQIVHAIKDHVAKLDTEIETLKEQTSEGREDKIKAREQEMKDKIATRHQGMHYKYTDFYKEIDREKVKHGNFVASEDIDSAKEYGDELVKQAIKEYYYKKIDEGADRKKKEEGLDKVREDFNYIEKYLESSDDGIRRVDKLVWWRKQIGEDLLRAVYKDKWERYGKSQVLEEVINQMAISRDFRGDPIESLRSESIDLEKQAKEIKNFWSGASRYLLQEIIRPERIIAYANKLEKALEQISETIRNNPEVLEKKEFLESFRDVGSDIFEGEKTKRYAFDDATMGWIKDRSFNFSSQNKPARVLARREQEITTEAQQKKDFVSVRIDMEWAEKKKESFRQEHSMDSILEEYRRLQEQRKQADEIMRSLSSLRPVFLSKPGEIITVKEDTQGTQYFELELSRKEFKKIDEELNGNKEKELVGKREELKNLTKQMSDKDRESEGIFHWKAKKIGKEYKELETKEKLLGQEIKNLEKQREKLFTFYLELRKAVSSVIETLDLSEYIRENQVTLNDILDLIPSKTNEISQRQLSPEKQELYKEYNELVQESEKMKKQFEQVTRYSSY